MPCVIVPSNGLEAERERCRDPEVRACAAQPPEELGVLFFACPHEAAVRGDELDLEEVVDREPVLPLESTHPTAERQSRDARVRDHPDGADESGGLRLLVELGEECAAGDAGGPLFGIHVHPRIRDRSITMPSSQVERPGMLWPPHRTATSRSSSRANRRAVTTSSTCAGRTISAGRRSRARSTRRARSRSPGHRDGRSRRRSCRRGQAAAKRFSARARRRAASTSRSFGAPS